MSYYYLNGDRKKNIEQIMHKSISSDNINTQQTRQIDEEVDIDIFTTMSIT